MPSQPAPTPTRARIAVALTGLAGTAVTGWTLGMATENTIFYLGTAILAVIWVGGSLLSASLSDRPLRILGRGGARRQLLLGLGAGAGLLVLFLVGALVVSRVPLLKDPVLGLLAHSDHGALPIAVAVTTVNGIAEEFYFRGALFQLFAGRAAIIASALGYSVVVAASGIALLVLAAVLLGLLTALLRQHSGALLAPIAAHLTWALGMLSLLPILLT